MAGKSPRRQPYVNGTKVYVFYENQRCRQTDSEWWPAVVANSSGSGKKIVYTVTWSADEDTDKGKQTSGIKHQYVFPCDFIDLGVKNTKASKAPPTSEPPVIPTIKKSSKRKTFRSPDRSKRIDTNVQTQMNIISSIQAQQTQMQIVLQNILALVERKPGAEEALIGNISRLSSLSGLSSLAWSEHGSVSGGSPPKKKEDPAFANKETAFSNKETAFSSKEAAFGNNGADGGVKRQKSNSSGGWKTAEEGGWTESEIDDF